MINSDDVKKLAQLSRIDVTDSEAEKIGKDMGSILKYVDQIKDVNVDSSGETAEGPINVLREDSNPHKSGIHKEKLVAAASDNNGEYIKVKNIL